MPIPVKLDILAITSTAKVVDYEIETERYNKSAKRASLPQFRHDDGRRQHITFRRLRA
ncbi:UPF0319 protein YccT precursor [Salmonella enterica subsp. enterica]|uniref:UPF0319 protein YccT n=1 Tax=Salmonella enterica I TaxID=59201 RepID=A0A3S4LZH6_SALET|nr:UPF0319 protein YccT precursor [Salmonella enterica subsp. enterica]